MIIDADSDHLKTSISEFLEDELKGLNSNALREGVQQVKSHNFKPQLVVRDINLFWISDKGRTKLKGSSNVIVDESGILNVPSGKIKEFVSKNAYNLSPNAALRPLYQEMILPNLVYVGGGSEMKYWLQLKELFENYNIKMPILQLRTSNILLPRKVRNKMEFAEIEDLFKSETELLSAFGHDLKKASEKLQFLSNSSINSLIELESLFNKLAPGMSIDSRVRKIKGKMDDLLEFTKDVLVKSDKKNAQLDRILKIKESYASNHAVQERVEHIIGFAGTLTSLPLNGYAHFGFNSSHKINVIVV